MSEPMDKSLELLFDYTKFHIGVYLALTSAYVTLAGTKSGECPWGVTMSPCLVIPAIVMFGVAGLAGGVIASSITQTGAKDTKTFLRESAGPWGTQLFRVIYWTWLEHTAFWFGLILERVMN